MATLSLQKEFKIENKNKKNIEKLAKAFKEAKPYEQKTKGKIIIK